MRIGIDIDDTITDTSCLIEQIIIDNNLSFAHVAYVMSVLYTICE